MRIRWGKFELSARPILASLGTYVNVTLGTNFQLRDDSVTFYVGFLFWQINVHYLRPKFFAPKPVGVYQVHQIDGKEISTMTRDEAIHAVHLLAERLVRTTGEGVHRAVKAG